MRRFAAVASFSVMGALFAFMALDAANPPEMIRVETLSAELRDRDGNLLRAFLADDGAWRLQTRPQDVSERYISILKDYEDQRFAAHPGIDPAAIARAALQYVQAGRVVSGASTLSMQVARLMGPRMKRSLSTKVMQALRAVQLEYHFSKNEILGFYLTLAPFGGNLEGVRAASLTYFGKEPKTLTLAEMALLVALPQSPERARPDRHPKQAVLARDKVLARLRERRALPDDETREAQAAIIPALRLPFPMNAPHLAQRLRREDARDPVVVSTLDGRLQRALEAMTAHEAEYFGDGASIAMVVVKTATREVIGEIGGTDYWGPGGQIDLSQAIRSPGSALKPFIYGLAFDDLALHPATQLHDGPELFGDYAPHNFDNWFRGWITARDALRMSLNVPAVMVLERVGPVRFALALEHAGAKLEFSDSAAAPGLPIALGGVGMSLSDLTMLYTAIADGGNAKPLREIQSAGPGETSRLMGETAAYYVRDIMNGAVLPDGWAMGQGLARKRTIGFKTGTSYGYRDAWAMGFSNDYTIGVWVGLANGAPRPGRLGRNEAAPILLKAFDLLADDVHGPRTRPRDALVASNAENLPVRLREFRRAREGAAPSAPRIAPPAIAFPPDGSIVSLPREKTETLRLAANGGRAPLTWLVNGALLGSFDRYTPADFTPDGEGFARITVVDADGRSATSRVRFKR